MKMLTIVSVFLLEMGKASYHLVKWSVLVRMCWFPDMDVLRSVTKSIAILSTAASFLGTPTRHDGQSAVLFHAPDIHSKVMLYVAHSND